MYTRRGGFGRLMVFALAALLQTQDSSAHDIWISRKGYVDPASRAKCCDEFDCEALTTERVAEVVGGYLVDGSFYVAGGRVLPSADANYWACFDYRMQHGKGPKLGVRCFFAPLNS